MRLFLSITMGLLISSQGFASEDTYCEQDRQMIQVIRNEADAVLRSNAGSIEKSWAETQLRMADNSEIVVNIRCNKKSGRKTY